MKKMFKYFLCFVLVLGIAIQSAYASSTENPESRIMIESKLTNNDTRLELTDEIQSIKRTSYQTHSDGAITESYEVTTTIPIITPFDEVGGKVTEYSCTAYLDITYYVRDNGQEIKITKVSGGWEPGKFIEVNNREVGVNDGQPLLAAKTLIKNPSSNTFSYDTGWDYVLFYPKTNYSGPRAYSEALLTVTGMGGSYLIEVHVDVPDRRP